MQNCDNKLSTFYSGRIYLYLSNYELWPSWQGRIWREVSISSEGVLPLKLQRLKSKINIFDILKEINCSDTTQFQIHIPLALYQRQRCLLTNFNFNTSPTCHGAREEAQSMSLINPLDVKASLSRRQQRATSK